MPMNFLENPVITKRLYPFSLTRPVSEIRIGILTIREKWNFVPVNTTTSVHSNHIPSYKKLTAFKNGNTVYQDVDPVSIEHPWQIFELNDWAIRQDFELITTGRSSQKISSTNKIINPENIFLEEGVIMEHCFVNASKGPVYIGRNAEIMEGCMVRGSLSVGEGAVVKMGAKIYGATTIGPYCIAGGEIKNSVFFGYSNKGHDGYLGDSVIGEWCNLGAGTSNSNLKNNAGQVSAWDEGTGNNVTVGTKCGLLMGDYSRSSINTSFNTGTVTGVCCNIFGEGLKGPHIPSFSWCGPSATTRYEFDKAIRDIANWKKLKKHFLQEAEIKQLRHIFDNN